MNYLSQRREKKIELKVRPQGLTSNLNTSKLWVIAVPKEKIEKMGQQKVPWMQNG